MSNLEQQIQAKLDELNALKEKKRKQENQKKIIVGSLVMTECEKNPTLARMIIEVLNNASERDAKKLAEFKNYLRAKTGV